MSGAKHTAGPWNHVSEPYEDGTPYQKIWAGPDRGLYDDDTLSGFNLTFIGSNADGNLIAAAPDLLASLKQVVAQIEDYERVNNLTPNPGRKHCWDSVARAHDAIAKAEGRDPIIAD